MTARRAVVVASLTMTALATAWAQPQNPAPAPTAPRQAPAAPTKVEPNLGGDLDLSSQDLKVALDRMHLADGYDINLFASEEQFPALANPLAFTLMLPSVVT